jgi:predicted RNase H-like nuclease/ppGpp synthetase/RelA/SpoT-type nucleotidyltranferase
VHFVGVDLAWGERKPTGLAVLDDGGRLLQLGVADTDEAIAAELAPYVDGPCLVAIDAPLVVTNASGNRPCEAALNRDFARFDAGAHPSNTRKPEFRDEPRGARLARLLGLDIDPSSTADRRAIEVYPHPATVALFRLGRTLKYKNKPGRSLDQLRGELLALVRHLEGLADASTPLLLDHPAWTALVARIEEARTKADLRRCEDPVDAVVCAYVALFAEREPQQTTTYGDLERGYIVTPTLPPGHRPAPRPAPAEEVQDRVEQGLVEERASDAVRAYARLQPSLREVTERCVAAVTSALDEAGINYLSVSGRAKSVASFAAKAARQIDGTPVYPDPLREITDLIGVRVITYLQPDVTAVAGLLAEQATVLDDRDMGRETASEGRFGYASRHLLLEMDAAQAVRLPVQVQVRTVLQHAWAEFEHDIRYKGTVPEEHVPDLDRRFTLAAGLLELADREFSEIRDRLQAGMTGQRPEADREDPRIGAQELAAFLAGQYADASWSRTDHYGWISGLLLELGVTSLTELAELLRPVDSAAINERLGYKHPPSAVRRLDDALLSVFAEKYLALHGNAHREDLLRTRLEKMRG